jgi:prepilin-type N-terminal cleavage/methylation domain-containing protein/prepilin-type processing-associated H-X9-DG protein
LHYHITKASKSHPKQRTQIRRQTQCVGFTLIELLVVIAIVCIVTAIILPVFAAARKKGRRVVCLSNMRQITFATLMYAQDYDERCPMYFTGYIVTPCNRDPGFHGDPEGPNQYWTETIGPYIQSQEDHDFSTASRTFMCPSDTQQVSPGTSFPVSSYGLSDNWADWYCPDDCNSGTGQAHSFSEAMMPSHTILLAETLTDSSSPNPTFAHALTPIDGGNSGYTYTPCDNVNSPSFSTSRMFLNLSWRHTQHKSSYCEPPPQQARVNVTYADGHVASRTVEQLSDFREWAIFQGHGDVGCTKNVDSEYGCWYP